jgi:hypothetical protein
VLAFLSVRVVKSILLSALAALLSALAAWIVTVNVYTTVKTFRHVPPAPAEAFRLGFEVAGVATAAVFALTLYGIERRRNRKG